MANETKDQLLAIAVGYNLDIEEKATKADIKAAIDAYEAQNPSAEEEEEEATERPTITYNGRDYAFKANTPKQLKVFGEVKPLKALIKDKEAMSLLIEGGNFYVERVQNTK